MVETSQRAKIFTLAAATWAIAFAIMLVQQRWFIQSDFLYRDDSVILPSTLEEGHTRARNFGFLWYLYILDFLGSLQLDQKTAIAIFKVFVLALFACVPALIATLLFVITGALWLSAAFALVVAGYPLAVDQGATFAAAAHPTFGAMVAITALGVFWLSWKAPPTRYLIGMIVVAGLVYLASYASPTMRLMVIAPVVWILAMSVLDWRGWQRTAIALAIVVLPLTLRWTHVSEHHYAQMVGRVDMSISTILANALNGIQMAVSPIVGAGWIVLLLYFAGFALLALAIYRASRTSPAQDANHTQLSPAGADITAFIGLCLLTAALAFGPSSVLTVFRDRYVVPAFLLIALGLGAAILFSINRQSSIVATRLGAFALALFIVANVARTGELHWKVFGTTKSVHTAAEKLVAKEKDNWGEESQVVLIVTRPRRTPTNGSMRRSTSYLRFLTGQKVRTGLIGRVDMLELDPFVDASLEVSDLQMRGLREDLPLYLYELDTSGGRFVPRDVLFLGDDLTKAKLSRFGEAPRALAPGDLSWGACQNDKRTVFIWPIGPEAVKRRDSEATPCVRR